MKENEKLASEANDLNEKSGILTFLVSSLKSENETLKNDNLKLKVNVYCQLFFFLKF